MAVRGEGGGWREIPRATWRTARLVRLHVRPLRTARQRDQRPHVRHQERPPIPVFGLALNGVSGFRLQVVPAKRSIELLKGKDIVAKTAFRWGGGSWLRLSLDVQANRRRRMDNQRPRLGGRQKGTGQAHPHPQGNQGAAQRQTLHLGSPYDPAHDWRFAMTTSSSTYPRPIPPRSIRKFINPGKQRLAFMTLNGRSVPRLGMSLQSEPFSDWPSRIPHPGKSVQTPRARGSCRTQCHARLAALAAATKIVAPGQTSRTCPETGLALASQNRDWQPIEGTQCPSNSGERSLGQAHWDFDFGR